MRDTQLSFWPGGMVTGIGSLPPLEPDEAVQFVATFSPEIPFWPQFPQRSQQDDMLVQALGPLADLLEMRGAGRLYVAAGQVATFRRRLHSASAGLDEVHAAGFFAFEEALHAGGFPQARLLKGQMYGPLTLARCLYGDEGPLYKVPGLLMSLAGYLCRLATWQVSRLRRFGKPVLLVIDEPALALATPDAPGLIYVRLLIEAIHAAGAHSGIHCCARVNPATLANVAPDLIAFDAHQQLECFLRHRAIQRFVAGGGRLAFGMIPTLLDLSQVAAEDLFARWVGAAIGGGYDLDQLVAQSLVTATCGLGLVPVDSARQSFALAQQFALHLAPQECQFQ